LEYYHCFLAATNFFVTAYMYLTPRSKLSYKPDCITILLPNTNLLLKSP
jgi:hypothetical protein